MKNGLFTTISSGKDGGAGHVNQQTTSKAGIRRKKVLLSVWNYKGIVYFELLF